MLSLPENLFLQKLEPNLYGLETDVVKKKLNALIRLVEFSLKKISVKSGRT